MYSRRQQACCMTCMYVYESNHKIQGPRRRACVSTSVQNRTTDYCGGRSGLRGGECGAAQRFARRVCATSPCAVCDITLHCWRFTSFPSLLEVSRRARSGDDADGTVGTSSARMHARLYARTHARTHAGKQSPSLVCSLRGKDNKR